MLMLLLYANKIFSIHLLTSRVSVHKLLAFYFNCFSVKKGVDLRSSLN